MKVAVTGEPESSAARSWRPRRARGRGGGADPRHVGARSKLGEEVELHEWADPKDSPAPAAAFADVAGVIHLLGEPVAQRWSDAVKQEIRDSRVLGTRNLVAVCARPDRGSRARVAVGERVSTAGTARAVDETSARGADFLAQVVVDWEAEAQVAADELGLRVRVRARRRAVRVRRRAREDATPSSWRRRPGCGGEQYVPWVHIDDVVGALLFALDTDAASGR